MLQTVLCKQYPQRSAKHIIEQIVKHIAERRIKHTTEQRVKYTIEQRVKHTIKQRVKYISQQSAGPACSVVKSFLLFALYSFPAVDLEMIMKRCMELFRHQPHDPTASVGIDSVCSPPLHLSTTRLLRRVHLSHLLNSPLYSDGATITLFYQLRNHA